jgi:transposase
MKKGRYKATHVKKVNWDRIADQTHRQRIVFGVDVAKEDFFAVLMKEDQSVVETLKWVHPQQTRELVAHLLELKDVHLEVAMESSGTYGDALRNYLSKSSLPVHQVSAKRVHDASEIYDGVPSLHDAKAAYLIGRLHLEGISCPWPELTEVRREQHALLAELDLFESQWQRNLNRLEATLSRHWPELTQIIDLKRISLLSLLGEYGSPQEVAAHRDEAQQLMQRVGRGPLSIEKVQQVLDSSETTLGVPCTEGERHFLRVLSQELIRSHWCVQELGQRIEQMVAADEVLTQMAQVVGKTTSLLLGATLGTPLDYPDAHSYLKALGLNLKERSSGKHKGQVKITKRGPGKARGYLYYTALRWLYRDWIIGAWYQHKVKRDGNVKGKAIVAIMRKLALALWYVARGEVFDSRKLFNTRTLGMVA